MPWHHRITDAEELTGEMIQNLKDNKNPRLIVIMTTLPDRISMRMTMNNPEAIAGVIYNHGIKTGQLNYALQFAEGLIKIGTVAKHLVEEKAKQAQKDN